MTKQEFLAANLPYRLKLKAPYGFKPNGKESTGIPRIVYLTGDLYADIENKTFPENFIPIVRHINDLTKECVQADYNNGEPFTPIVELVKILEGRDIQVLECEQLGNFISVIYLDPHKSISKFMYNMCNPTFYSHWNETLVPLNQLKLFQQLLRWHFDLITEECEKIYVTEEFNPYK